MKTFNWPANRDQVIGFFERPVEESRDVAGSVAKIIAEVRRKRDVAVAGFTQKFDGVSLKSSQFELGREVLRKAWDQTPRELQAALRVAARRIEAFHKRQRLKGWTMNDPALGRMELRVQAVERAGVYAPGGRAAYPSTVLMDIIPAKVAGVKEVILVTPPGKDGFPNRNVMAAAWLAGADRVFRIGGAQAIAALAYGTATIPRVDKIVGPGNIYVATAKQQVYGRVDIDSIAGPTEVLILADSTASLRYVAADMLAQCEHDPDASAGAVLIGGDAARAKALEGELAEQVKKLERREIASASLKHNGYIILAKSSDVAAEIANMRAPEHIEILTKNARALSKKIQHAGAIFIGPHTPEPVGDYIAGPNHTLPTGGTARFFSPLSVWTFYKTCHTIECTPKGLARHAKAIETLAHAEGLGAHAESVAVRFRPK